MLGGTGLMNTQVGIVGSHYSSVPRMRMGDIRAVEAVAMNYAKVSPYITRPESRENPRNVEPLPDAELSFQRLCTAASRAKALGSCHDRTL
jgi:hypothetical protein